MRLALLGWTGEPAPDDLSGMTKEELEAELQKEASAWADSELRKERVVGEHRAIVLEALSVSPEDLEKANAEAIRLDAIPEHLRRPNRKARRAAKRRS